MEPCAIVSGQTCRQWPGSSLVRCAGLLRKFCTDPSLAPCAYALLMVRFITPYVDAIQLTGPRPWGPLLGGSCNNEMILSRSVGECFPQLTITLDDDDIRPRKPQPIPNFPSDD